MYKIEFANGMIIISKPFNTEKVKKVWNGLRKSKLFKLDKSRNQVEIKNK